MSYIGKILSRLWRSEPRVITNPAWQWMFAAGKCERCGVYVPRLVRRQLCHTPWRCDECTKHHDGD
jgi:hypothetical protein